MRECAEFSSASAHLPSPCHLSSMPNDGSCYNGGYLTPVLYEKPPSGRLRSSRETLSAVAHGGNHASSFNGGNPRNGLAPQDLAASPRDWLRNALPPLCLVKLFFSCIKF
ncbi:hypothetical protein [Calothrix sp. NIES-2098]|uniref:hypothetical protein n=1 Tax=Calothrix sp. NIES-2098 TaxID=1954171 RepID=UPI0030D94B52